MNNRITQITWLTLAIALFAGQDAMAAKVYQWTDEEGVVHFSDAPPKDNTTTEIQEMDFVDYAENGADPDRYSISNQLERMAEWRRQITEERLARKQLQLEEQRLAQERNANRFNSYNIMPRTYYQPVYYYPSPLYFTPHKKWYGNHFHDGHHSGLSGSFQFKSRHIRAGVKF